MDDVTTCLVVRFRFFHTAYAGTNDRVQVADVFYPVVMRTATIIQAIASTIILAALPDAEIETRFELTTE